jgi:tRNA dimethylallyltransferase
VGKTALAVALAADLPVEAVSVDSRQVFRGMDIATGKPTPAERRQLPHHLIDVAEPDEAYDAARFAREAAVAIETIRARGRLPVLVGGTGLYYRALVKGLAPAPPADPGLRRQLRAEAESGGPQSLHARLTRLDPATASRLHPRDLVRVIRALEVVVLTGRPASESRGERWRGQAASRYRVVALGLAMARESLYRRLDARVDAMIDTGLLGEVETLLRRGFAPSLPSMQGIGYRHLVPVAEGRIPLAEAVRRMKRDTRRYAKRQVTWFAREETLQWLPIGEKNAGSVLAEVKKAIERTGLFHYPGYA